ncbi:transposase [Streptomyces sp. NPDC049936]|uniref:transposase n=1 Tax=Streptomyces sp. NPDC049936 TaxID=3365599 RepID=UPI0037B0710A
MANTTLICDGRGNPLHVITTAANVNDITQTLALVDGIAPVAGQPDRPRQRPQSLLGDLAARWERRLELHDASFHWAAA